MYNNPENIGPTEILRKLGANMSYGQNRNKRYEVLYNYSTDIITTEEWIKRYCNNIGNNEKHTYTSYHSQVARW